MLQAYFDESYGPKVFTLAGLVSSAASWGRFSREWNSTLRRFGIEGRFHMNEFESGRGDFTGWATTRKVALARELARLIRGHAQLLVGVSVLVEDFARVYPIDPMNPRDNPLTVYEYCMQSCLERIATAMQTGRHEIDLFFDRNRQHQTTATHFQYILAKTHDWDHVFGSMTFASSHQHVPLQAADVVAYENYKQVLNQFVDGGRIPPRKLHEALRKHPRTFFGYFDGPTLERERRDLAEHTTKLSQQPALLSKLVGAVQYADRKMPGRAKAKK